MAYANKQDQRDCWNRWYEKNKKAEVERRTKRKKDLREWLRQLKVELKCAHCGEDHPACLQFHHTDPNTKDISLSKAVQHGWSIEKMKREIEKCVVLCANCHFKEHFNDQA